MIFSITLNLLKNAEYIQFQNDLIDIINGNAIVKGLVNAKLIPFVEKNNSLQNLFKTDPANPITKEIELIDFERDQAINGLIQTIKGLTNHFNAEIRNAAQQLKDNLNLYGSGIATQNYQAETSIITNIVNDWENKPNLKQALITINHSDWVAYLKDRNVVFNQKYVERTQEYGGQSTDKTKLIREEANQTYYKLRDLITSYANINENDPDFEKVINQINALIEQYNLLLTKRAPSDDNQNKDKEA